MPAPPNILLWVICLWWFFRVSYWLGGVILGVRDGARDEERKQRELRRNP